MRRHYDFILAGGGAAGLSLAYHLAHNSYLGDRSVLIVDQQVKARNDHTWCSWLQGPAVFDALAYRTWDRLAFYGQGFETLLDIAPYRYRMIRAVDFYRHTREVLAARPNVDFLLGKVERVVDGPERAEVLVNELTFEADWVFDSRYDAVEYRPLDRRYHYLIQHFVGWEIETPAPAFDPLTPHFFDFRTPQDGALRFFYVLPYSERRALVEYTLFSARLLPLDEYAHALRVYLSDVLGIGDYRIVEEERDLIPMTERPFLRRAGRRVLNTGTRGGRVKASTGFAFARIQDDCAAIVRSLQAHGHPFDLPQAPARYRLFDALLLQILYRHGDLGKPIFTELFRRNPPVRILRFLDEQGSAWENVQLTTSLPPWPFVRALLRLALLRRA